MNWKQFLTEKVLGECWHELTGDQPGCTCKKCGAGFSAVHYSDWNPKGFVRTFATRNDLMDLYQQVYKDGKWGSFSIFSLRKFRIDRESDYYNSWRFCLNGEGYEERCKAVAEFYGWNEQRDPVIDKNSGAYRDN